jgi:hypothetical protein
MPLLICQLHAHGKESGIAIADAGLAGEGIGVLSIQILSKDAIY